LKRAKETCYGIFGKPSDEKIISKKDTTSTTTSLSDDDDENSGVKQQPEVTSKTKTTPMIELPCLVELTQKEIIFQRKKPLHNRIQELQDWLDTSDATNIAIVGHSEYFMYMLGLNYKFKNCDVWKVEYNGNGVWNNLQLIVRLDDI
jgi:hypothetical protein